MSKGLAVLTAMALMALPSAVEGQEIGVQVQVLPRTEQPVLEASRQVGSSALVSDVPAGWSLSVQHAARDSARRSHTVMEPASSERRVVPILEEAANVRSDYVTVTFARI